MEVLKLEFNELTYPELWGTIRSIAKDEDEVNKGKDEPAGLKQFKDFTLVIIAQKPKETEPETFQRRESEEPETFGKRT